MNPLLISGFGTSVFVEKRKLIVLNRLENNRFEFYPHQIDHDSIIVDGHTGNITFEAMRWLMKHGINLTLLNWNGNILANLLPQEPKSGKLRIMQYSKYLDSNSRMEIATRIVKQKIENTANVLKELAQYYSELDINQIERTFGIEKDNYSLGSKSLGNLMNYEGRIATFYWNCLAKIFNRLTPEFNFASRKNKSYSWNMNASDEINALLNYGYAILESEIRKDLNAVGLDASIGFLHEIAASKEPLVYDIQELFRWLIDLSIIQLLEEKKLKKSDFIVTENYHTRLRETTAKALIEKISLNFNRKMAFKGKNYSYQNILQDNVQQLANIILNKSDGSFFNVPQIGLKRNDTVALKGRILAISTADRKRLGINKSTLWYQQKNLREGKMIRVYNKVLAKIS